MTTETTGRPAPPAHLREAGRALWETVTGAYDLEPHEVLVLAETCEARDREVQARAVLDAEGLTVPTAHGVKTHPAASVERDARGQVMRGLAAIKFPTGEPSVSGRDSRGRFAGRGV